MKLADESPAYELTAQAFSRAGQTDWLRSLKRLARAQAILWASTSLQERQRIFAQVDGEQEQQS